MRIFKLHIVTEREYIKNLEAQYANGAKEVASIADGWIAEAHEEGYNKGKADGIEASKRAFAQAVKQKQGE